MIFFQRVKNIEINLGSLTMEEVMNFQEKESAGLEEFYLKEMFNPNHIQIGVIQSRVYTSGIHDFEYDTKTEQIKIISRFKNSAFLIYGYLIMPIIPLILDNNNENTLKFIGITIAFFIFLTLVLIFGIKSESKSIERKMIARINFLRKKSFIGL